MSEAAAITIRHHLGTVPTEALPALIAALRAFFPGCTITFDCECHKEAE